MRFNKWAYAFGWMENNCHAALEALREGDREEAVARLDRALEAWERSEEQAERLLGGEA